MNDNTLVPANEIWYTTVDGKPIELIKPIQEKTISNTYKEGKGVIIFKEPVTEIGQAAFFECTGLKEIVIPSSVIEIRGGAF